MNTELFISRTKLVVPQRRKELLSRPRLLELLSDLLDYRLIIVAAPAGYGKTSLLIDFATQFDWPFCWHALDPLDNDLHRFLSHFVMSIRQRFPDFGSEAIRILSHSPADQINTDHLISVLTNEVFENIPEHFVVVLDDYHLLQSSPQIDQFLSDFIQRADDNCHIVITSRKLLTLPDLPLMVARSQVGGLSIEELAFTPDEIHRLYSHVFHQQINRQEAQELATQTDGWITGLLLTSQTLKSGLGEPLKITRASGIGLYEYLTQQVFDLQSLEMQQFLLHTSILEEFNAEMCAETIGPALNEHKNYASLMNRLVRDNLFVLPVDEEFHWLRYHHLFRDFLQARLESSQPDEAGKIRLHLAQYFFRQQDYEKAVDIYRKLNRVDKIIDLIEEAGPIYIARGKMVRLTEWLQIIPEKVIQANHRLQAMRAVVAVNQGHVLEGKDQLDAVISLARSKQDIQSLAENLIRRSSALRLLGFYEAATADAKEAIQLTKKRKTMILLYSEALRVRGAAAVQMGKMKSGLTYFNQALEIYRREHASEDIARILVEVGFIQQNLGQYVAAETALKESLSYWQSIGDSIWIATILNNLGVLQHLTGNFVSSFYNLEKSASHAQMTGNLRMQAYALASLGDLYRDLEAIEEAANAYQKALGIARQIEDQFLKFFLLLAEARLAIQRGDLKRAGSLIQSACKLSNQSQSAYDRNKCLMEQAAREIAGGHYTDAHNKLAEAYPFFEQESYAEDGVRAAVLLLVACNRCNRHDEADRMAATLLEALQNPARKYACLSAANELRRQLRQLREGAVFKEKIESILAQIADFKKEIHKSRHKIRSEATVVPFAPAKINIRTFGKTEIRANKRLLTISDWKTATSRDLFLLFLAHPEGLTKEEVGEIMWPDSSPAELKLRFKNAIYRMRHAIGSDVVVFKDDVYQFDRYIDYEYDAQNFISLTNQARVETDARRKIDTLKKAVEIYRGDYLPEIDEHWVLPDRQKYHDMQMRNLIDLATLCSQQKDFEQALHYCQLAIQEDACQEEAYRLSMQVHAQMGNKAAVSRQYRLCQEKLHEEVGVEPSPQTVSLFEKLMS